MEIVGLLVIVILIVIIIFFSLTFRKDKTENIMPYQDMKFASQLGITISETTVKCGTQNVAVNQLIRACATGIPVGCNNPCELLNNTIDRILDETLRLDLEHNLIIRVSTDNLTNFITEGCKRPRRAESAPPTIIPIGDRGSNLVAILTIRICQ
jgi:hypothetical protein